MTQSLSKNQSNTSHAMKALWLLGLIFSAGLVSYCAPSYVKYSGRNPDLFQKPTDSLIGQSRGIDESSTRPEMYVKERKAVITDLEKPNTSGSLFNPDSEVNYLFTPASPAKVGRYLSVQIKAGRTSSPTPEAGTTAPKAPEKADPEGSKDTSEADLLKALPDLAPKDPGKVALLKDFKMLILHKYPNGDVLARVDRNSKSDDDFHNLSAEARIPYERLASGDALTTDDLMDVKFKEHLADESISRSSSGWQDEYSLRLSGFHEAKSKAAGEIADQKSKLMETKERLEDRIKSLGSERKQLARLREEIAQKRLDADNKVKEATQKYDESSQLVEEQQQTIDEQKQKLDELEVKKAAADEKKGSKDE